MKNALFLCLQFVLFLIVFVAGSLFPPFHIEHVITTTPTTIHLFIADGLVLMIAFYLAIAVIEVVTKRIRTALPWTTIAVVLAAIVGLVMKFGFITRDL
jgi:hypothetical protein